MRHILPGQLEHRHGGRGSLRRFRHVHLPRCGQVESTLEPAAEDGLSGDARFRQFRDALSRLRRAVLRVLPEVDRQLSQRAHLSARLRQGRRHRRHCLVEVRESLHAVAKSSDDRAARDHRGGPDTIEVVSVGLGQCPEPSERARRLALGLLGRVAHLIGGDLGLLHPRHVTRDVSPDLGDDAALGHASPLPLRFNGSHEQHEARPSLGAKGARLPHGPRVHVGRFRGWRARDGSGGTDRCCGIGVVHVQAEAPNIRALSTS